jgi:hypothetical protein
MDDIGLPRHVIDRLEHRWANRLQQDAKAWSSERGRSVRYAMCRPYGPRIPVTVAPVVLRMPSGSNRNAKR